jgi:uncharacterized protein YchJ
MKVNYPESIIEKSSGFSGAEKYLGRLCNNTFLSLWAYPNIFRDQGRTTAQRTVPKGDGKEVCDLLVVFGNHVLIFSDKHCKFPNSGNIQVDWSRWYRKAVRDAAKQVWGAERWIFQYPENLFLEKDCVKPFPFKIPSRDVAVVHRIVVAYGGSAECIQQLGGTGSLMICPAIIGDKHVCSEKAGCLPFAIGLVDPSKGFVHILDDTSLEVVMKTLDTISDFTRYLTKKEELIKSGKLMMASGEDDLLAYYLRETDANGEHTFLPDRKDKQPDGIAIVEGLWKSFCKHHSRLAQIRANEISYSWDALIEKFIHHLTSGTLYRTTDPDIRNQEEMFRILASEDRTGRRMLAEQFVDLIKKTPQKSRATRLIVPTRSNTPYYLYLVLPKLTDVPDERYREVRGVLLEKYLYITKLKHPTAKQIVGLATETGINRVCSEDFAYLDVSNWTKEDEDHAKKVERELIDKGLLGKQAMFRSSTNEYPDAQRRHVITGMKGSERNESCPCGSGKKFKKCCGFGM